MKYLSPGLRVPAGSVPSNCGELHPVSAAAAPLTLSMKICRRACPATLVKSPSTSSSEPPWDNCWLNTSVALAFTPGKVICPEMPRCKNPSSFPVEGLRLA